MVRCPLVDSGLPPKLWGELMLTAAYLCNCMPHSELDMETPFKRLYSKEDNLSHLKIMGARAFVHIKNAKKLEPKSWEGMLCGFSEDEALSYRVWNPKTRRVVESRNVMSIETPPHLVPQSTRLSLLRELPPAELVDEYASTDDLLRDARDYTSVLDFNTNIQAEHANADIEAIPNRFVMLRERTCSYHPANLRLGEPRPWKCCPGNTVGDIITFSCAGPDAGGRSGRASALSGTLSGTFRSSCALNSTSGATQRTCAHANTRGKCIAATTNTQ